MDFVVPCFCEGAMLLHQQKHGNTDRVAGMLLRQKHGTREWVGAPNGNER